MDELVVRTLSQGLQAFLPVAFGLAWARRTDNQRAAAAMRGALYAAVPVTVAAGYLFQRAAHQARWEAALALTAVAIAAASARMFSTLQSSSGVHARGRAAVRSTALLAAAAVLIVVRQTMEIEVVLTVAAVQMRALAPTLAIVVGLSVALVTAWLCTVLAPRMPASANQAATRTFLVVFALQAAFYAFHEAAEARFLPWSDVLHIATEPYGPDGIYGRYASFLLLAFPLLGALLRAVCGDGSRRLGVPDLSLPCNGGQA